MGRKIILNAKQLRIAKPTKKQIKSINHQPIYIVLDNILDTFNIGSFFRLADAVAVEKIFLCGKTVTPPNIKIHRASVGTWRWVPWEHKRSTESVITDLKEQGILTVAVELSKNSINYKKLKIKTPIALIIGHESFGISKKVLDLVDKTVRIPMFGVNTSLNVLVAASIVVYDWINKTKKR